MLTNRNLFQSKAFNVDEVLNELEVTKDFEEQLDSYLDQVQKDIVSVLDLNYNKLQELGHKINVGLNISDKIDEELQVVDKMIKNTSMVSGDVDAESPEGKLVKIKQQKQILLNEHFLKLDLDYLKNNKIEKPIDMLDYAKLEMLEYYLLIANRAKSYIESSTEDRQQVFIKQYEPFRSLIDQECRFLVDLFQQFKIQFAVQDGFADCLQIAFKCLVLSGKWADAFPVILNKLIAEPISDLQKTLSASVNQSNFEMKYGVIENYLKGIPLLVSRTIYPFASHKERVALVLDFIFQNVVKHITDQKLMASNNLDYTKDYQKSLYFIQFFKSNFVDPFQLEKEFKSHPGFIVYKRKFNPIPFANVQKSEITKKLSINFDPLAVVKNNTFHFEYFSKLNECLDKIQSIQIMPQTLDISTHLLFLVFDNLLQNTKNYNDLNMNVIELVFDDLLKILLQLNNISHTSVPVNVSEMYKRLINQRFSRLQGLFVKVAQSALRRHIDVTMTVIQQIRNIPSIVRMGSKEVSTVPSSYVIEFTKLLNPLFSHYANLELEIKKIYSTNIYSNDKVKEELVLIIIDIANQVLATIRKTEESLKRFKKKSNTTGISDEDKMRAQIYVDCCTMYSGIFSTRTNIEFELKQTNIELIKEYEAELPIMKAFVADMAAYFK
eukprot:NODE_193_length_15440_cov_0.478587.p2 type:complete len:665 gc:universal NODE_193_length_15440_cov_0.478587:12390-10396(-)